jgi:ATP-dependent DNA helicase PIF1
MESLGLSYEQEYAFNKFKQGENLFITGPGGSGKTRLVKIFNDYAELHKKYIPVCAMTGCAAVLLNCNARTLHSWSGIKLAKGEKFKVVSSVLRNQYAIKKWRKATGIILDEVSMLSKKIFEIIEEIARKVKNSSLPFGGMQVIFTGDFFQLPPVGTEGEPDTEQFCFESPIWNRVFKIENQIELKTIFRQNDPVYINILNEIRRGELSDSNKLLLQSFVNREYDPIKHNGCIPTKLFALRAKADYVNTMMFSKIKEKEFIFEAIRKRDCFTNMDSTKPIPQKMIIKCRELSSTDIEYELEQMVGSIPCPQVLRMKKGAAVMCTINLDMENGICNGSQGVVIDIIENTIQTNGTTTIIKVRFSNGITKDIGLHYWQSDDYPMLAIGQYPICLAWALTIHKIQGATLSMAEMDVGQSIFEYGQTYVALSRIKSLDGLYLSAFHSQKIKANPRVNDFYMKIPGIIRSVIQESEEKSQQISEQDSVKKILEENPFKKYEYNSIENNGKIYKKIIKTDNNKELESENY